MHVLSQHELRAYGQLAAGQAHRLTGEVLWNAGQLEDDSARLYNRDPALGRALTGTHAGLGRLLRDALVGEDVDPDLAAALDLARHRDTSGLDLAVGQPSGVEHLEPVLAELHAGLRAGEPALATAMHLA